MADQTTANIRIILEDGTEGGGAPPPPTAGQSVQPVKSPDDIVKSLPMWADDNAKRNEEAEARQERYSGPRRPPLPHEVPPPTPEEKQKEQDDKHRMWYREAQQAITGISRGAYFGEHFGMAGMVGQAGQFLEAGQSIAKLAGGSEAGIAAVAGPAGAAVAALGAFAIAVDRAADAASALANKTAEFGGAGTAMAQAEVDVRRTQYELESAQRRDEPLARFTEAKGELGLQFEEASRNLLDMILPILTEGMTILTDIINAIKEIKEAFVDPVLALLSPLLDLLKEAWALFKKMSFPIFRVLVQLARWLNNKEAEDDEKKDGAWFAFMNKEHFSVNDKDVAAALAGLGIAVPAGDKDSGWLNELWKLME